MILQTPFRLRVLRLPRVLPTVPSFLAEIMSTLSFPSLFYLALNLTSCLGPYQQYHVRHAFTFSALLRSRDRDSLQRRKRFLRQDMEVAAKP